MTKNYPIWARALADPAPFEQETDTAWSNMDHAGRGHLFADAGLRAIFALGQHSAFLWRLNRAF